jgi:hypothetical protein
MANLKRAYSSALKEILDSLDLAMASQAKQEKAYAKKLKGLEAELEATRSKASEELKATVDEAKIWAAKSVIEARVKMAKEAAEPGFDRASWDVARWEQQLLDFDKEDAGEGKAGGSGKDGVPVAGAEGGAVVGDDDVMQV